MRVKNLPSALALAALCLLLLFAAGCDGEGKSEPSGVLLSSEGVNTLKTGQTAYIKLDENKTTPYGWECVISDETLLALTGDEYVMDPNPNDADGVGGTHTYYFEAKAPGECVIDMNFGDFWESAAADFTVTYAVVIAE